MGNKSAGAVLDRLHVVFGVDSDNGLSDVLGIKRSTLGNWRSRDSVPYTICVDIAATKGLSLDWLLTGEGPMLRGAELHSGPEVKAEEWEILDVLRGLDMGGRMAVLDYAQERRTTHQLRQQMNALQEWVEAEGDEASGPLMASLKKYLATKGS